MVDFSRKNTFLDWDKTLLAGQELWHSCQILGLSAHWSGRKQTRAKVTPDFMQSQEKTQCWLSIISPTHRFLPSFYILIWGVCLILVLAGTHILSYLGWWLSFLLIDIEKSHWCQYVKIHSMVMVRVKQNHWKTIVSNDARKKNITIAPFGKN